MAARMCVIILRNGFEFVSEGYDTLRFIFLHFARMIGALEYFKGCRIFNYILSSSTGRKLSELLKPREGNKASVSAEVSLAQHQQPR